MNDRERAGVDEADVTVDVLPQMIERPASLGKP